MMMPSFTSTSTIVSFEWSGRTLLSCATQSSDSTMETGETRRNEGSSSSDSRNVNAWSRICGVDDENENGEQALLIPPQDASSPRNRRLVQADQSSGADIEDDIDVGSNLWDLWVDAPLLLAAYHSPGIDGTNIRDDIVDNSLRYWTVLHAWWFFVAYYQGRGYPIAVYSVNFLWIVAWIGCLVGAAMTSFRTASSSSSSTISLFSPTMILCRTILMLLVLKVARHVSVTRTPSFLLLCLVLFTSVLACSMTMVVDGSLVEGLWTATVLIEVFGDYRISKVSFLEEEGIMRRTQHNLRLSILKRRCWILWVAPFGASLMDCLVLQTPTTTTTSTKSEDGGSGDNLSYVVHLLSICLFIMLGVLFWLVSSTHQAADGNPSILPVNNLPLYLLMIKMFGWFLWMVRVETLSLILVGAGIDTDDNLTLLLELLGGTLVLLLCTLLSTRSLTSVEWTKFDVMWIVAIGWLVLVTVWVSHHSHSDNNLQDDCIIEIIWTLVQYLLVVSILSLLEAWFGMLELARDNFLEEGVEQEEVSEEQTTDNSEQTPLLVAS